MKKILLGTTALVSLFAATAFADAPTVTVGGSLNFQYGYGGQKSAYQDNMRDYEFANDTRVDVKVQGKTDNGLVYGGVIELLADVSKADDESGFNADKTFIYLESMFGRVEAGSNVGADKTLKVDASTFARATGGIAGDWYRYINENVGTSNGVSGYILTPDLPIDAGVVARDQTTNDTKLTYYTPVFAGLQAGFSYAPDSADRGTSAVFQSNNMANEFTDAFDTAVKYTGQFSQVGVAASATGQFASSEVTGQKDISAYALGLDVNMSGFTLGGSWADWGKSGELDVPAGTSTEQDFWTIGGSYVQGPVGASVSYLNSKREDNKFYNVSLGADYQLAPGLVPYAEVNFFDLDPAAAAAAPKNDGTVFLLGTQLTF